MAISNDSWFDLKDKDLFNLCLRQIQKKATFEIRVSTHDADAVKDAITAFVLVDEAGAQRFPKRLIRLIKIYFKSFRFPTLMGIVNSAQLARFTIFMHERKDGLSIVFEESNGPRSQ